MQRSSTRTLTSGLALAVAGAFLAAGPATTAQAAATPTAKAYGLAASITIPPLLTIPVAPAAPTEYPAGPATANQVPVLNPLLGSILSTGVVTSESHGVDADGTSDSTSSVAGLNVLNILKADAVTSSCTADGGGVVGTTNLANLKASGSPTGAPVPAPNTNIAIAGVGTVVLNEQIETSAGGRYTMSVNALHVTLNVAGIASGDIVVGHSECAADAKAPTVTGIAPSSGPAAGGTAVTITGTGFTKATAVRFGTTPATSFTVTDGRHITAVAPAGPVGTVDVSVTNRTGTSTNTAADDWTYTAAPPPTPAVTAVAPALGPAAGGTQVAITGTGLGAVTGVTFGGTPATGFTVDSATAITATAPAGSAGTVDVRVTSGGGTSADTAADDFRYVALPVVGTALPDTGPAAGGTTVVIGGSNLTGATDVEFGGVDAGSFTVDSPTQITATTPAGTGTVDITVTTPGGESATGGADFTYTPATTPTPGPSATPSPSTSPSPTPAPTGTPAPTPTPDPTKPPVLGGISPARGPVGGGQPVRITGSGFSGATGVSFGGAAGTQVTVVSDTLITVRTPAHARGAVPVTVTGPGGTSAARTYTYLTAADAPRVTSVAPAYGSIAGGTRVTLYGAGFDETSTVSFGGVAGRDPALGTASGGVSTTLTVTTPAHAAGPVTVVATNGGGGTVQVVNGFVFVPPMIGTVDFGLRVVAGSTISVAPRGSGYSQLRVAACSGSRGTTSVTTTGGACVYTAPANGTDVFTMTVVDVLGQTASQRVRIRVVPTASDLTVNGQDGAGGAAGAIGTPGTPGTDGSGATATTTPATAEDDTTSALSTDGDRLTAGTTGDNLLSFLPLLLGMMTGFVVIGLYVRRQHRTHPEEGQAT